MYKDDLVSEVDVEKEGGALGWRAKSQRVHPHIAILARKYLAVQASSSAASERVFSVGALVVTKSRNRLSGDRVADIVFLHSIVVELASHRSFPCQFTSTTRQRIRGVLQYIHNTMGC